MRGSSPKVWVTPRFLWLLAAAALLLACSPGIAFLLPLAIILAGLLIAATIADAALAPRAEAIAVIRTLPEHFALGVDTTFSYAIENRSRFTVRLGIYERPVRTLRYDTDELTALAPAQTRVTSIRPVTPIARGAAELGDLYLWQESAAGLVRFRRRIPAPQAIRVYPDLSAVERYGTLHVRNRLVEAGLRRIALRGAGTEFESLREWSNGDAFRAIDWKATARRGKFIVAQHEVERSQNLMLLLDCGRLMTARIEGRRKLDYAVTAALSLASIAGLASDRVGLVAFAREIITAAAPRSTKSSVALLSEQLYALEPRFEESNYARAFAYLRHHLHKRSMIVFLTDVIDPLAQAALLAELASLAAHHLVLCVFMNDGAIAAALADEPETVASAYRSQVAISLAKERRIAKTMLERNGATIVDVPARRLTTALIDEYLRVKRRGLL